MITTPYSALTVTTFILAEVVDSAAEALMSTLTEEERIDVGRKPAVMHDQKEHGRAGATSGHIGAETLQPYKLRKKVIEFGEEAIKGAILYYIIQ